MVWAEQREDVGSFGRYRIRGVLGEGGMGRLYVAEQTGIEGFAKIVALKRILPHLADSGHFRGLFLDEARTAARLSHPNIVATYELGEVDGTYFMAMEYLPGEDLSAVLRRCGTTHAMPAEIAAFVCQQAANGLHHAHQLNDSAGHPAGLVHRDVNPSNIFVSYHGVAKLLDFGVVKAAGSRTKTTPGTIKGKYGYCAPEQLEGDAVDPRTDVFSLGVVLWECLTGRRLFEGPTDAGTIDAVRNEVVVPARQHRPDVPRALDEIALKALQRDRSLRYQSAGEMEEALDRFLTDTGKAPSLRNVGEWMERLFGAERAALRRAVGQGTDVEASLARLAQISDGGELERSAGGKSPTGVRPRTLWSARLEAGARRTSAAPMRTVDGPAPIALPRAAEPLASVPAPTAAKPAGRASVMVAVALALVSAGGIALLLRQYGRREQPIVTAPAATAALEIASEPAGAHVFVDGNPTGLVTPATLSGLPVGRKVEVRLDMPEYQPVAQVLEVRAGAEPHLFRLQASAGTLVLRGLPAHASVYVDGSQVDPGAPIAASVGPHRVRVEADGEVVFTKSVAVHGGEQTVQVDVERSAR